jgi:signal transduction histidine kinase
MLICRCSKPRAVQPFDALRGEQIAVGDHARDHAVAADVRHDQVQIGMQQGLAAADGDDGSAQRGQHVEALAHGFERHRFGAIVVFVAVGAGQIAAAHGDDMRQDGMVRGNQSLVDHAQFAGPQVCRPPYALIMLPAKRAKPSDEFEAGEFLLHASHDLRTALRAIRVHTDLLLKDRLAAQVPGLEERLGFIVDGALKIDLLADGIASYSIALQIRRESFQPAPWMCCFERSWLSWTGTPRQ